MFLKYKKISVHVDTNILDAILHHFGCVQTEGKNKLTNSNWAVTFVYINGEAINHYYDRGDIFKI